MIPRPKLLAFAIALLLPCLCSADTAVPLGVWRQFSFLDAGEPATGCEPFDPDGLFCDESFAGTSTFLGPRPWTFFAPAGFQTQITITDAFEAGDQFQVFDFGSPIGITSPTVPEAAFCGTNPDVCLLVPEMSSAVIEVEAGEQHSITIVPLVSPFGAGSAYFRIDLVPEPATGAPTALAAIVFAVIIFMRRTKK
jgi:hypothetical protein